MSIAVTLGQLALAERALKTIVALRFPMKTAYTVHKLAAAVEVEMKFWHQREEAWIRELGDEDTATGQITVKPEHRAEFLRRMADLATIAIELQWCPLTFTELETAEDPTTKAPAKLAPADLLGLGPLLAEDAVLLPSTPVAQEPASTRED